MPRLPPPLLLRLLLLGLAFAVPRVRSHQESGEWRCDSDSAEIQLLAEFRPGVVAVDGRPDDWDVVDGSEFALLPALDPDADKEYNGGKMTVKALHDGKDVFFLLQVDGDYVYSPGNSNKCPSVALMFQIGQSATYHDMGGCKEGTDTCTSKTCGNPIDNAKGNGGDRFGHLVDLYGWTPQCRYLDGTGPSGNDSSAQNNWRGAWWHSSLSVQSGFVQEDSPYGSDGGKGTYYFELSRPLRTMDRLQLDVQFTIGESSKISAAFWYPVDETPWHGSVHFTINCDWVSLDITSGGSKLTKSTSTSSWDLASVFSLLFSVIALCLSVFTINCISRHRNFQFSPMEVSMKFPV
ncbi:hypothetical protein BT93_B2057 [Corymbia citriodora subsp. variegata]|nr:hypothetical protein BT93_B2057 [Corymbia citriodora subsp. variegata]